jgi:cystathionine beta-lyase/cystathionine gamma-synthase
MSTSFVTTCAETRASRYFRHVPCGDKLPDSIHAVSVSLPALQDLVGYERGEPEALKRVTTGYPRFHAHPYVVQIQNYLSYLLCLGGGQLLLLSSPQAANNLCEFAGIDDREIVWFKNLTGLVVPAEKLAQAKAFRQHTGTHISSRLAEDFLIGEGMLERRHAEECLPSEGEGHTCRILKAAYGADNEEDVFLSNAGMNAVYGVYQAINAIQRAKGRDLWVQFGWLFMDTMRLVEKLRAPGSDYRPIHNVFNLEALEAALEHAGGRVAGIITETPSNPLVRTPDVAAIRRLAEQYDCALVIDSTLGTPYNVDVLPHADVVIESLTKYANGAADVMMGAVVLNSSSRFYEGLKTTLPGFLEKPYARDLNRLAFQISGYAERMKKVNENTTALAEFLNTRKSVKQVFWAYQEKSRVNYEKIHRAPDSPGGIITLELREPLATVYDRLEVAKGPSLGAEFTLVGPYLYHAHYDLVSSEEGREFLRTSGLNPELLRISVGVEDTDDLLRVFSDVLE